MDWKNTLQTIASDVARIDQLITDLETYRDEKTAQIAHYLRVDDGIELDLDAIRATLTRPYTLLPISENEAWLIHWRGVKMPIFGWVVAQEPAFIKAKVTRTMDLLTPMPGWMKDELGWKPPEHKAVIDGTRTGITLTEGDASSFRRKYGKHLDRTLPDGTIKIKGGDAWIRLVAALVKDGILPYAPTPVAREDWKGAQIPVVLKEIIHRMEQAAGEPYIQRAVEEFFQKGAVLINYPPGTGKTLTTSVILNHMVGRVLLLADTTMLIEQWRDRLAKFAPEAKVTLSTYQGAAKYLEEEWDLIVFDESQRLPANTFSKLAFAKTKYRIGLSVGGDSMVTVESVDGIFHCAISDLYKALSCGQVEGWIDVSGFRVRAFDGQSFVWKPIRAMLRHHLGAKMAFRIWTEKGRNLLLTEDHSIYRVGSHSYEYVQGHKKPIVSLEEAKGSELRVGDYVLLEDSLRSESCVDEFDLTQYMEGKWYVAGDFESWIRENVNLERFPGRAARERWQRIHRSQHGVYVTGEEYMAVPELRKQPGRMYTEGAIGVWAHTRIPVSALAYLLGFYIGDGWVHGNKICFAVENERVAAFLQEFEELAPHANFNPKVKQMRGKSCEVQLSSKALACFFRGITQNGKAASKRIPPQVFQFSDDDLRRFVQGMLDSDGHLSVRSGDRTRWFYTTVSKKLALDLCELLKRFDVTASLSSRAPGDGGIVRGSQIKGRHTTFVVHFSDHAWKGNNEGHFGSRSPFIMSGLRGQPVKITKIQPEATDYVYDISVDDDSWQTFVASGILVHNTGTAWREDDRQHLIVALSGFPVAIRWAEMITAGVLKKPRIIVATVSNEAAKTNYVKQLISKRKGRALIFCDWIEQGQALADALDVPFVHGNSPRKLQTIEESEVCVVSRIGDRGISLPDLRLVIEVAGAGSAREQFAQRVGRLLHGNFEGTFITVFTPEEAQKYRGRVFGVEAELAGSVDIEFIDVGTVTAVTDRAPHKSRVVKQARASTPRANGATNEPADEIARTLALPAVAAKVSLAQKGTSDSRVRGHILNVLRYCWTASLSPKEIMEGLGQTGSRTLSRLTSACKAAEKIGLMTVDEAGRYRVSQEEIERLRALSSLRR